jgi:Sialidase, N-terminal domain.
MFVLFALPFIKTFSSGLEGQKALRAASTDVYEGNVITKEGAWCWFADPRSLHYENTSGTINSTYIAYIDIHGNIKATQHNFLTGRNNEVLIRSWFQPDDHDVPTFLVLPDERIMIFYSRHTDEARFYYRVSKKPGDITTLGDEKAIIVANNTTYPNPFILSDDPTHIYLCWRGINWHPTIAKLTIPDGNDNVTITSGPYQIVQSTGARPYAKYFSNGKDKIYLTYTTGHPDNEYPNWVYYNYINVNGLRLYDIKDNFLSSVADSVHHVYKTAAYQTAHPSAVVDAPTAYRDWVWQTTFDKDGNPVIAMVQISYDKNTHVYYYAKWTGTEWRKTYIANAGPHFHQTANVEMCYSAGMAIDDANPNILYASIPITGANGKVYEIMKYTIGADGSKTDSVQITTNSALNNVRPFIVANSPNTPLRLTWMHGNYYYWLVNSTYPKGYPTEIRSQWALPVDSVYLNNGLLISENFNGSVTGTASTSNGALITSKTTYATLSPQSSTAFSISLSPYLDASSYSGTILTMGNLTYGVSSLATAGITSLMTPKPYVTIDGTTYNSSNTLGTYDTYWNQSTLSGVWANPTKLKFFNLTLTYENGTLKIFRNGLIDQVIDGLNLTLSDVKIGGFVGLVEDCNIYNRALNQYEVKKLTETSLYYNSSSTTNADIASLTVPQNIYTDVIMPASMPSGNTVTWTSSNTGVIATNGIVTLPQNVTPVTLTATINGVSKSFTVNVYPRDINNNKVLTYTFDTADLYSGDAVNYLKDKSGNNNDATVYGSAVVNGALDLTANTATGFTTNGYATAPSGILDNIRSYTFIAKVRPMSLTSAPRIYDFGCSSGNSVFLRASAFTAGFKYNGGTTVLINSPTPFIVNQEDKVAVTFDAKSKATTIYLNGTVAATATTITNEPYMLSALLSNTRNYIGRTQWWDTSSASSNVDFNGTIDDFYLFNIALTADEINQVQNNANTAVNSTEEMPFKIFPNPAIRNNSISIYLDNESASKQSLKLEIINSEGQILNAKVVKSNPVKLDGIRDSGVYILRIISESEVIRTAKLIIQ